MNQVLLVVRNEKLAQTIIEACQDRGAITARIEDLKSALARFKENQQESDAGTLFLDLSELDTKSDKKINSTLSSMPSSVKVIGLGSGFDLKSVTSFYRSGMSDFLNLPLDAIELTRCLNNVLGSLADNPSKPPAKAANKSSVNPVSQPQTAPVSSSPHNQPGSKSGSPTDFIIGQDPGLKKVFRIVEKVAATDSTVMIHGESGTGKELIARAIHFTSPRRDRPLIPVNCGAIPEELLETELFGHEKGAFTNAIRDRIGRFEMADGGTIFLDEIGDMSPKLQVKLLRVIQEHQFERVGGDKTISIDIRIITATHVDLTKAVENGRFREDLFYRLNVIPLTIPPLRDRANDIPLLVDYFLTRLRETRGSTVSGLTKEALAILKAYKWPGNIRELENLMERMVILADDAVLTKDDLPPRLLSATKDQIKEIPAADDAFRSDLISSAPAEQSSNPFSGRFSSLADKQNIDNQDADKQNNRQNADNLNTDKQNLDDDKAPLPSSQKPAPDREKPAIDESLSFFLEPLVKFPQEGVNLTTLLNQYEEKLIQAALAANANVKNQAAKALGLNRTTFLDKLKKRGLE
jgi:DNA-binding NtrC family response regulator